MDQAPATQRPTLAALIGGLLLLASALSLGGVSGSVVPVVPAHDHSQVAQSTVDEPVAPCHQRPERVPPALTSSRLVVAKSRVTTRPAVDLEQPGGLATKHLAGVPTARAAGNERSTVAHPHEGATGQFSRTVRLLI